MVDQPAARRTPPRPGVADVADRAARVRYRRAVTLMAFTLVAPGSAQLIGGKRRTGRIALRIWLGFLAMGALVALLALVHHPFGFWFVSNTHLLLVLRVALIAGAIGWAWLFVDAWRIGRPLSLRLEHRRAVVGINGILCFSVVATLLFGAHLVSVQRDLMLTLFANGPTSEAANGRYNVLLLGGDSGKSRWGMRPDSIQVASIDEKTGRTVLIGLPRNMKNFPFADGSVMDEEFPGGFDEDYLNGVNTWALDHADLFGASETAGVDATIMAVEGITGLEINYWVMVNMQGFKQMVDAVGGVEMNVRQEIPIGLPSDPFYDHIQPGKQTLTGFEALWFARARQDSDDYSRMARQKCVINALARQVSPQKAIGNFQDIAEASTEMLSTNLPASEVGGFMDLAIKAKGQKISSVSLVPPAINTGNPDIDKVHAMIESAIDKAEGNAPAKKPAEEKATGDAAEDQETAPTAEPRGTRGGAVGSLKEGYAANQADDVGSVC